MAKNPDRPFPNTEAVIFDFDGVIVESMGIKEKAFVFLFQDHPEYLQEIVRLHRLHGGLSRFEKFRIIYHDILKLPYSERTEKDLGEKFSGHVYQEVVKCPFVAGAKEFLEKYHKKMPLFIVSGTPEEEIKSIVKERGLGRYFLEVFGSPETKGALCLRILQKHKFSPREVCMVGDSLDDYEGARVAGIKFIGRVSGDNVFEGLKTGGLIDNLFDLEKLL